MSDFVNDIPLELARRAHSGTSFVPERRGDQEREGYAATLAADYADLSKLATTDEKRKTLDAEFARYRAGYRAKTIAQLIAQSRCLSSMITGPSNFPTRRNEKRNATERRRLEELVEFRPRALAAIRKALCPELRPIMSGDSDAATRLSEKIEKAQKIQELMTAANKIVRRKPKNESTPDKLAELAGLGLSESQARQLFVADFCGRFGFANYELTNNNANIRRMKERAVVVDRNQSTPDTSTEGAAATVEDCPSENRVRLFFPGKPSEAIRADLKRNGFRWTPSLGCWQAYRNYRSQETAKRVAELGGQLLPQ